MATPTPYLGEIATYGFNYAQTPANKQFTREMTGALNDFVELGNFYTLGGGQVIRLSVVGVAPGVSIAQSYEFTTIYDSGDSGWKRLIPEKSKIFFFFNDIAVDVRTNIHTTYLRLRKTVGSNDPFTVKVRLEFLGNYDSRFTETSAAGNDATVSLTYDNSKPANDWIIPDLNPGWSNFNAPFAVAAYRKSYDRKVEIKGLVKKSSPITPGDVIFTLRPGFRTLEYRVCHTISVNSLARIDLQSNGDLAVVLGDQGWISLEISFTAED